MKPDQIQPALADIAAETDPTLKPKLSKSGVPTIPARPARDGQQSCAGNHPPPVEEFAQPFVAGTGIVSGPSEVLDYAG